MKLFFAAAAAALALATPAHARDGDSPRDFRAWLDQAVQSNMRFPAALERSNSSGIATVRFSAGPDGRPADVALVRSSGVSTIDRAALQTIATLDLPADAPAGPHLAVLQYGSAASGEQLEAYSAQLRAADRDARLALRSLERQRHARAGGARDSLGALD